jgi:hypothetical protein
VFLFGKLIYVLDNSSNPCSQVMRARDSCQTQACKAELYTHSCIDSIYCTSLALQELFAHLFGHAERIANGPEVYHALSLLKI